MNVDGDRAISLNNRGLAAYDKGDLQTARKYFESAIEHAKKALEDRTNSFWLMNLLMMLDNLGHTLHDLGDLQGALGYCLAATKAAEKHYGIKEAETATFHSNLGGVLISLGDVSGAEASFNRALAVDRSHFKPVHPKIARDLNNIGMIKLKRSEDSAARILFEEALAIEEQTIGPENPEIISTLLNLASALTGELPSKLADRNATPEGFAASLDRVRGLTQRALGLAVRKLGQTHPMTIDVRVRLAALNEAFPQP